jgi:phosphatidylserine/phosphatidylglycerophosphate/cardiolipin synthase-like enzyme
MANDGKIVSFHSNDIVFLAWQYQKQISNCLGFTVRRKDLTSPGDGFKPLPAWVGWEGGSNGDWQPRTTDVWPVQKFTWRDLTAKAGSHYQYEVVPMVGAPDALEAEDDLTLTSPPLWLTPDTANNIKAYFNNGILSTQHISHMIPPGPSGAPNYTKLMTHIQTPGDSLRNELAGQMIVTLKSLLARAVAEGGECYCAIYELNDKELIQQLLQTGQRVHIILSTAGTADSTDKDARQQLHAAGIDITDRMLSSAHIGHNKFVVYVGSDNVAKAVLAGSTNWTYTGLCAQSNNSVIIEDPAIANFYWEYWQRLLKDTKGAQSTSTLQSSAFRNSNANGFINGDTTVWFSPNTQQKTKPQNPASPPDLNEVFALINAAKQAVLFLEFQPGSPSVLDPIKEAEEGNPSLFIRGAATDASAIEKFDDQHPITTQLYHRSATGDPDIVYETGVAATAINDEFAYWKKELLKSSPSAHAIIHDKIVVIDPLTPDCVVITGSHNQGYKASYANDENLLIIRGNQPLAQAYTTHIMDVYDHYRWRYLVQQEKTKAWSGLQKTPDWQDRYFQPGNMAYMELQFWMSGEGPQVQAAIGAEPVGAGPHAVHGKGHPAPGPLQVPVVGAAPVSQTPRRKRLDGEHRRI